MRSIRYGIIIAAALGLILLNALYGHHLYVSPSQQSLDKYSVYVHLQPGWNSAPANILYDVTLSWGHQSLPDDVVYNTNQIVTQNGREAVLLYHGLSNCESSWSPPLYRYGSDTLRSLVSYAQGTQINTDPYSPLLPDIPNTTYSDSVQYDTIRNGYVQFIPVCTSESSSTLQYSISINDPGVAFDAHFVPFMPDYADYYQDSFERYTEPGCSVSNRHSYTGYCSNVTAGSGLLIAIPDSLQKSLTNIDIFVQETTSTPDA